MITGKHGRIRSAETDDAPALQSLYDPMRPRAALLDQRMEPMLPTRDELRELLSKKDTAREQLFTIEDLTGDIMGFCSVRGAHPESRFAEAALLMFDDAAFDSALADEAATFLKDRAFVQMRLNKLFAQCLDCERALRGCLVRHGFQSEGARREVLHTQGRMYDVEALSIFARDVAETGNE